MERDYYEDSRVDKHSLDDEYERHPAVFMHWGEQWAKAHARRLELEEALRVVRSDTKKMVELKRAEIDGSIRSNPEPFGFDKKPTEAAITNTILVNKEFREAEMKAAAEIAQASEELIDAIRNEEILKTAERAMGIKKTSLEGLTNLFLRDYFPRLPKGVKDEVSSKKSEGIREGLDKKMRTRRKEN